MGATREEAALAIRLIMLVNDVTLRNLTGPELAKGFGFVQSKPASAFTPVAVTPDELGHAFDGAKVNLPLLSFVNGQAFGKRLRNDMTFDFPTLIAHAAKTRALGAGTILAPARSRTATPTAARASRSRRADWAIPASPSNGLWRPSARASLGRRSLNSAIKFASKCAIHRGSRSSAPSSRTWYANTRG